MAIDPNYGKGYWIDRLINTAIASAPVVSGSKPLKQVVTGVLNGSNVTFTLPSSPPAGGLLLFLNGIELVEGTSYSLAGNTITMTVAPLADDSLVAYY